MNKFFKVQLSKSHQKEKPNDKISNLLNRIWRKQTRKGPNLVANGRFQTWWLRKKFNVWWFNGMF
jgi:hypothetical protein